MWNDVVSWIGTHFVTIVCCVGWVLVVLPSVCYLCTTWRCRRDRLYDRFTADAVKQYFGVFYPSRCAAMNTDEEDTVLREFRSLFRSMYGWKEFVFPLVLLGVIAGLGLWATAASVRAWLAQPVAEAPFPGIAISAFLGAYAWVLFDQIARFRSEDFTAADVRHVTDTISQALLWLRFEANVRKLYPLSLRGAQDVCALLATSGAQDISDGSATSMTIDAAANALEMDSKVFLSTLRELSNDPHARFLHSIWRPDPGVRRVSILEA